VRIRPEQPLVLGSASPRRRELLSLSGVPFVVAASNANESQRVGEWPSNYLDRIALAKLEGVRALGIKEGSVILVADTIVVLADGSVLGKPPDEAGCLAMLARLQGKTHEVQTRFLLGGAGPGVPPLHAETVTTFVAFRQLTGDEMHAYARTGEGLDKAGGYAVQGRAAVFVRRIEGSYTNVVGLPLCEVVTALDAIGWLPGR
jgi:septum formation protein